MLPLPRKEQTTEQPRRIASQGSIRCCNYLTSILRMGAPGKIPTQAKSWLEWAALHWQSDMLPIAMSACPMSVRSNRGDYVDCRRHSYSVGVGREGDGIGDV